jgi:hypothetical protein
MSPRFVRTALALSLAAGLVLAAPASAASRTAGTQGWLAAVFGGLEKLFGYAGGYIDPNGGHEAFHPSGNRKPASERPTNTRAAAGGYIDPNGQQSPPPPSTSVVTPPAP